MLARLSSGKLLHFGGVLVFIFSSLLGNIPFAEASRFTLEADPSTVPIMSEVAVNRYLQEAIAFLPPKILNWNRQVTVAFKPLDDRAELTVPPRPGSPQATHLPQKLGYVSSRSNEIREIFLDVSLLSAIEAGPQGTAQFAWGHKNLYRLALAVLLHEIAHVYDFANVRSAMEQEVFEDCMQRIRKVNPVTREGRELRDRIRSQCQKMGAFHQRSVTDDDMFKDLTGFVQRKHFLFFKTRVQEHDLVDGGPEDPFLTEKEIKERERRGEVVRRRINPHLAQSPDNYEYSEVTESFAVNFEFFLLDPEYACRRPSLHRYFINHFDWDPYRDQRDCQINHQVLLSKTGIQSQSLDWRSIDPSRVYQVHYLYASAGKPIFSRFGHAMFLLVLCGEETPIGPDCMSDVGHHLVVSFRANVDTPEIDSLKGLTGYYPSQLFLLSLADVVEEYNVGEFRDLESYPLYLTDLEKELFVLRVTEQYWDYSGNYYFFSNNCATESMKLVRTVIQDPKLRSETVLTPGGIIDDLSDYKVLDVAAVKSPLSRMGVADFLIQRKFMVSGDDQGKTSRRRRGQPQRNPLDEKWSDFLIAIGVSKNSLPYEIVKSQITLREKLIQEKLLQGDQLTAAARWTKFSGLLWRWGLSEPAMIQAQRKEAKNQGLLWPSIEPEINQDFKALKKVTGKREVPWTTVEDYLHKSSAQSRRDNFFASVRSLGAHLSEPEDQSILRFLQDYNKTFPPLGEGATPEERLRQYRDAKKFVDDFFSQTVSNRDREESHQFTVRVTFLEEHVYRVRNMKLFENLAVEIMEDLKSDKHAGRMRGNLRQLKSYLDMLTPHAQLKYEQSGYGIPLSNEIGRNENQTALQERSEAYKKFALNAESWVDTHYASQSSEIRSSSEFTAILQTLMRGWLEPFEASESETKNQ